MEEAAGGADTGVAARTPPPRWRLPAMLEDTVAAVSAGLPAAWWGGALGSAAQGGLFAPPKKNKTPAATVYYYHS